MTNNHAADLAATIEWLKVKHALNQYALDYMSECCVSDDEEIGHMEVLLHSIVSDALTPVAASETHNACQQADLVTAVPVAWQQRHQGSWITMGEKWTAQDCADWPHNEFRPLYTHPTPLTVEAADHLSIAKERADWLLDAVACATQDRRFLRGDPEYDEVAGEVILLNAEKAILTALRALSGEKS